MSKSHYLCILKMKLKLEAKPPNLTNPFEIFMPRNSENEAEIKLTNLLPDIFLTQILIFLVIHVHYICAITAQNRTCTIFIRSHILNTQLSNCYQCQVNLSFTYSHTTLLLVFLSDHPIRSILTLSPYYPVCVFALIKYRPSIQNFVSHGKNWIQMDKNAVITNICMRTSPSKCSLICKSTPFKICIWQKNWTYMDKNVVITNICKSTSRSKCSSISTSYAKERKTWKFNLKKMPLIFGEGSSFAAWRRHYCTLMNKVGTALSYRCLEARITVS